MRCVLCFWCRFLIFFKEYYVPVPSSPVTVFLADWLRGLVRYDVCFNVFIFEYGTKLNIFYFNCFGSPFWYIGVKLGPEWPHWQVMGRSIAHLSFLSLTIITENEMWLIVIKMAAIRERGLGDGEETWSYILPRSHLKQGLVYYQQYGHHTSGRLGCLPVNI